MSLQHKMIYSFIYYAVPINFLLTALLKIEISQYDQNDPPNFIGFTFFESAISFTVIYFQCTISQVFDHGQNK